MYEAANDDLLVTTGVEMIGRADERARLDAALARATGGENSAVMISGEPGIGKTCLLKELATRAEDRHCLVLEGRATEFEQDEAFAVFADALDAYLASREETTLAELRADGRLSAVFPALAGPGSGAVDRLRTHAAVRSLLGRLAESRAVVLILDDLHWADTASIDLFGYLVRHPPRGGVLIAAALRPAQAPLRLRQAIESAPDLVVLPVGPLARHEVAALLPDADAATVAELFADSGGNPFYLNALSRIPRRKPAARHDRQGVPAPVLHGLDAELRTLSPTAQRAAWGAAVAGDPFETDLAAITANLAETEFLAALDELVEADLVRPTGVPRRFRFRHPIVRSAVYEAAGPGWRQAAHGRAAAALAERGATALTRAHHVEHSAATADRAAIAVLTAAGQAAAESAPAAAAHWFTAALRLLPDDADATGRAELLAPLALSAGAAGQFEASRRAVDELLTLVPAELAPIRVELVAFRAFLDHVTGRVDDARTITERELRTLDGGAHVAEQAALRIELANNALVRSDYQALARYSRAALRDATTTESLPLRAAAGAVAAFSDYTHGRIDRARAALARAGELLDRMPDEVLATRLDAALLVSFAEYNLDHHADAIRHAERGLALATGGGHVLMAPMLYITRACARAFSGQLADAIDDSATAYEVSAFTGSDYAASLARGISSWVHVWRGDLATALRHADEALRLGTAVGSAMTTSNVGLFRAEALLESGRPDRVRDVLLGAAGGADLPLLERPWRARAYQVLIRAALATDDPRAARDWLARAHHTLADIPLPSRHADVLHAEAAILVAGGDFAAAVPVALAAADAAERGGVPVEAGRARILAGLALAGRGDRARGIQELLHARQDLAALGANRYRDHAVRELRRLGRRVPASAPASGDGGLSTREREIAELVATGSTNRQIAARLVISERTVETHVTRILRKLDLASRAAVGQAIAQR